MTDDTRNTEESPFGENSDEADVDALFDALSNSRRRAIITMLAFTDDNTLEIGDIAERIAADENDKPAKEVTADERKRVYISVLQVHGPTLDSSDIADFDNGTFTLEQSPESKYALEVLDRVYDAAVPTAGDIWTEPVGVFARIKSTLQWGNSDAA